MNRAFRERIPLCLLGCDQRQPGATGLELKRHDLKYA